MEIRVKENIRKLFIDRLREKQNEAADIYNWQQHKTPYELVEQMVESTDLDGKNILVLFNLELIEILRAAKNIPEENIRFIADTKAELDVCKEMYGVEGFLCSRECWAKGEKHFIDRVINMGIKKFNIAFSNPPYNRGIDLKIMSTLEKICDEMVIVHPSTWLIDLKGKSKLFNETKALFANSLKSATLFNGNPVFGIGEFVPCVITHIDKRKDPAEPIRVEYFGRKFKVTNINDITNFGPDWHTIVKPFFNKMKNVVAETGSVWDHNVKEIEEGKHYCQLAAIRGNVYIGGGPDVIVQDDFYTLVMKDSDKNKGIRKPNLKVSNKNTPIPTYVFDTEIERDNFISYCKTFFVRFCLSNLKVNQILVRGELSLIPWLDFTQEWTDEKLFEYFNIDKKTQDYIYSFLPDYYGLLESVEEEE